MKPSRDSAAVETSYGVAIPGPENGRGTLVEVRPVEVPPVEVPPVKASGAEVWDWLWLLWDHRRFLARAVVCGMVISSLIALVLPKSYESTIRLMPPDNESGSGLAMFAAMAGKGGGGMLNSLAGDLLGMRNSGVLFIDILRGRTVEDHIVSQFDLRKEYSSKYWVDARKRLATNTEIAEDRKSGVITITVTDRDPHRAAQIAQAYVDELDHVVADVSTSSARRERIFIEDRLKTVKQNLDESSEEFSQFASRNGALDITVQGKAMVEAAARLQGELIAGQSELEGLEQIYTADNVRVRSLRARVGELQQQLDKLSGNGANRAAAPAAMNSDPPNTGNEFPSIRELPLLGVRWADLYRQTKIQETVFELLTQQYELTKIEEAKEIPVVKVLDPADVPERRSFPRRTLIVLLSGLFVFLGAAVWVCSEAIWQRTDANDAGKMLVQAVRARVLESGPMNALRARWSNRKLSKLSGEETRL
jgi:capsule polysaccharide export protein KpsE/RkpR